MSVIGLHGVPGSGKTLSSVVIARKHFKRDNSILKRIKRKLKKQDIFVNTVYSNFPILLNKRKNIYSRVVSVDDCNNSYSFIEGSIIILDEVQAYYDSYRDFKNFPRSISSFFQMHRHFGIKNIYLISQHPRRLVTYFRDVITEFERMKKFIKIPFLHIGIISYRRVYEFEDYQYAFTNSKEQIRQYDIKKGIYIFNYKKTFNSFLSNYLYQLNIDKALIDKGIYTNVFLPNSYIEFLEQRLFSNNVKNGSLNSVESHSNKEKDTIQNDDIVLL